jgi:alpha-N-arabinofuranosidase
MLMNQIKIDLERILSDIDRNIFGGYLELGERDDRFEHIDIGDSPKADKSALRSDVRTAYERLNHSNIRFPGGNFASSYDWRDGVGPREERPIRYSTARRCVIHNQYGTNEFMRFCRAMNIEPYLCVNCGDGDMRMAADWVEYCNGTGDTALVKLRQKHGFTEPHKVKYWGIGNEVDSIGQVGTKSPQEYARAYTEFSKVMKRVDPDIKLFASAVCMWEDMPNRESAWVERAQLMLEQAGDRIDYMAIHRYAHTYYDDPHETYMAFGEDFNERLTAYEGLIRAVSLERGIKHAIAIAVDEWGLSPLPAGMDKIDPISLTRDESGVMRLSGSGRDAPRDRGRRISNLEDALITGLYLNAFIRHAYSVRMANHTPGIGRNLTRPDSLPVLPTGFYPFELYSRTCGQLALDVFWYGDTFSGTFKKRAYTGIRTLDVAATLDESRKQLVVYVVNQSKEEAMETTISLTSGEFTGNVKVSLINGPDIKAENTEEKPNQVVTLEATTKASGKSFNFTFEPHSVTALVCAVR